MNKTTDVAVIGAGISGLAVAYWLHQRDHSVQILEKSGRIGGSIQTSLEDGYVIEHGPNSGLETNPDIGRLAESLNIRDEMIYAGAESNNRYIVKESRLHPLPMSPPSFLKTNLFSGRAKLRVLGEFFRQPPADSSDETVADFVRRRLGPEFLDYAINPFVAGVFAGDPEELSVRAAFPKLAALEDNYGGIFKGVIKGRKERKKRATAGEESKQSAQMFSFQQGLSTLTDALGSRLGDFISTDTDVTQISRVSGGWQTQYLQAGALKSIYSSALIMAVPAYAAAEIVRPLDNETSAALDAIPYAKAIMVFSGFPREAVPRDLDGFGYLIPEKADMNTLGTIWTSTVFPGRAPEGSLAFTTFMGGRRQPDKLELTDDELVEEMLSDFNTLMGIKTQPETLYIRRWPRAIPQYTIGHLQREAKMREFEEKNPGLYITGNHRGGISVADCIKNSVPSANAVDEFLKSSPPLSSRRPEAETDTTTH